MKFRKKPLMVDVRFSTADSTVQTLEGAVASHVGDAILTGEAGEHWPVVREAFENSYEPIPPLEMGEAGGYRKRPLNVQARQVAQPEKVALPGGAVLSAQPGDWIVTGPNGDEWVVEASIFAKTYDALAADEA